MIFAQFYHKSAISEALVEACGDRAVIILDGRESRFSHERIAARECAKRKYLAWRLFKGDSFTRCVAVSGVIAG